MLWPLDRLDRKLLLRSPSLRSTSMADQRSSSDYKLRSLGHPNTQLMHNSRPLVGGALRTPDLTWPIVTSYLSRGHGHVQGHTETFLAPKTTSTDRNFLGHKAPNDCNCDFVKTRGRSVTSRACTVTWTLSRGHEHLNTIEGVVTVW